jgi:hypothetical protein
MDEPFLQADFAYIRAVAVGLEDGGFGAVGV